MAGLLASLPLHGQGWHKAERDRFLHTFTAVLDFCFPAEVPQTSKAQQEEPEEPEEVDI